jgi:hypothetical protein
LIYRIVKRRKFATASEACDVAAVPVIKKYLHKPAAWVLKNKIRVALNKKPVLCFPDKKS